MELAYQKLMEQHQLKTQDLPKDAQIGIRQINSIMGFIIKEEKNSRPISEDVLDKIKANDKWVVREILDYIEEKESGQGDIPHPAEEIIDQIKDENKGDNVAGDGNANNSVDSEKEKNGIKINDELKTLFDAGKTTLSLDELKLSAKNAYDLIFETYEKEKENGIETWEYRLVETEKQIFKLSKI